MKYVRKDHTDRNRHKNRIKRSGQARLVYVKNINLHIPTTWRWARGNTLKIQITNQLNQTCFHKASSLHVYSFFCLNVLIRYLLTFLDTDEIFAAIIIGGRLFPSPNITTRMAYIPNAGLRLLSVSSADNGLYTARVTINLHGTMETHVQRAHVISRGKADIGCLLQCAAGMSAKARIELVWAKGMSCFKRDGWRNFLETENRVHGLFPLFRNHFELNLTAEKDWKNTYSFHSSWAVLAV